MKFASRMMIFGGSRNWPRVCSAKGIAWPTATLHLSLKFNAGSTHKWPQWLFLLGDLVKMSQQNMDPHKWLVYFSRVCSKQVPLIHKEFDKALT